MNELAERAFAAAREFAYLLVRYGRDDYGSKRTPLFVTQLNAHTRRIPACTPEDPGMWLDDVQLAAKGYCQNLLFDFGLMELLKSLTAATGDSSYDAARRDYLSYALGNLRHPKSGYIAWGEHVGYDVVRDEICVGGVKGEHEVKCYDVPWDDFWEIDPGATRHEIEVALYNHICDESTFAFNRHAPMDGTPNTNGYYLMSLSSSAGTYIISWVWLYKKTGERKFLDWARKMNRFYWDNRAPSTGLIATGENRPKEMWYCEAVDYATYLFIAADRLGPEGDEFREQALAYALAYDKYAWDAEGRVFFNTINVETGRPVIGRSPEYPPDAPPWLCNIHPKHLAAWVEIPDTLHTGTVLNAAAIGYSLTGDPRLRGMFDRALEAMDVPGNIARGAPMFSADAACVIFGLLGAARRSGDLSYMDAARPLVKYMLDRNMTNGFFVAGGADGARYYCSRAGSANLASAVLAWALEREGRGRIAPVNRDLLGGIRS